MREGVIIIIVGKGQAKVKQTVKSQNAVGFCHVWWIKVNAFMQKLYHLPTT